MNGNLIIRNASELVTVSGFAGKKGSAMADLGVIRNGAGWPSKRYHHPGWTDRRGPERLGY